MYEESQQVKCARAQHRRDPTHRGHYYRARDHERGDDPLDRLDLGLQAGHHTGQGHIDRAEVEPLREDT